MDENSTMTPISQDITALLAEGVTVITPIRRLSRYLLQQYAELKLTQGEQAWESPTCMPWNAWLNRTWNGLAERSNHGTLLLGPYQQQRLWQSIIQSSPCSGQVLQIASTARQANRSRNRCLDWQIPIFPDNCFINDDAHAFRQWNEHYQRLCERHGWIDEAMLPEALLRQATLIPPQHIALYGFDTFTPLQEALLGALESVAGFSVTRIALPARNRSVASHASIDVVAEIRAAAFWARQKLNAGETHIGIVVHNLHKLHRQIRMTFEDVLCPGSILVNQHAEPPFNISLGLPLSDYPIINTALSILTLGKSSLLFDDISDLLHTPFIKAASNESQQLARLEKCIRRYGEYHLTRGSLLQIAADHMIPETRPTDFLTGFQAVSNLADTLRKRQSANAWAKTFSTMLTSFGWPGERTLNSHEYQTFQEWQSILGQFVTFDQVGGDMSFNEALSALRNIIKQSGFQPETTEVPIQIMGMTAAAAMQFDHLWIMGLSEDVWPPETDIDPFIPMQLQREYKLPDATPESRLEHADSLLQELIASSPEVLLSYPQQENDRPLRPAPALRDYPVAAAEVVSASLDYAAIIHAASNTETLLDQQAPVITTVENHRGGASLFRDQAACPFRAFAKHRLYAEGLEVRDIGLDALKRGNIVHSVLELFWKQVDSQQALNALTTEQLTTLLRSVIKASVDSYRKNYPMTMGKRFATLESERLEIVVRELLQLEQQRHPFRVKSCEEKQSFLFADIGLSLRTDRIDELADGRQVIIDYKTSSTQPTPVSWITSRPDEPQLPLYAINNDAEIAAVIFTWVKRGKAAFRGVSADENILPGVKPVTGTTTIRDVAEDWNALLQQWRDTLTLLATDFREGKAQVDPKTRTTCDYCDLHAFCRVYERQVEDDAADN